MSELDIDLMQRIAEFTEAWPSSLWGPAHIVLEDLNLDDRNILSCIRDLQTYDEYPSGEPFDEEERAATIKFLSSLLDIDESDRCP